MSTDIAKASRPLAGPFAASRRTARPLRRSEKILVALEGFIAICGAAGGIYLMARPLDAIPVRYLDGTWFDTWRWPGLALFVLVGVCPALAVGAQMRRLSVAPLGHLCVGAGLIAWIALEAAWVVVSPPMQIFIGLVGVIILALAIEVIVKRHRSVTSQM